MALGVKGIVYDGVLRRFERRHGATLRRAHLAAATGRVIEVGAGTGANLPWYPTGVAEVVAAEPDGSMRARLRRRSRAAAAVSVVSAAADALPFPDDSFDTAVATLTLCTVPSQADALRELRRVLRPGGQLLFMEHVRSRDPGLARRQDRLERAWGLVAGGCHPNRDTLAAIEDAGFEVVQVDRGLLPAGPRIVRPYVTGRGVVPSG